MISIIEILCFFIFSYVSVYLFSRKDKAEIAVYAFSFLTISLGEYVNAYKTFTVTYNEDYLLWFPGEKVPVFIILIGVCTVTGLFILLNFFIQKTSAQKYFILSFIGFLFVINALFPFLEQLAIHLNLWHWNRPSKFIFSWYTGVYKFYFYFLTTAMIPGIILKNYSNKARK